MSSSFRVESVDVPLSPTVTSVTAAGLLMAALILVPVQARAFDMPQLRGNAQAEQSRGLGAQPRRTLPATGRYVSEGGEAFVFDRSGPRPLFRFESRSETWALRPTPAPRGDIIYRNDAGDQILRVTPDGGMTLFSVRSPAGSPASMSGSAPALDAPVMGPIALVNLMLHRSDLLSRSLGRTVVVQMDVEADESLCIDALLVTTDAVIRMAGSAALRPRLATLRSVTIVEGRNPGVTFERGDLRVAVRPGQGLAGRPSSAYIIRAVASD